MSDADVIVVGAGLAGLVAARDLTRGGLDVVLLEARDRVGGRLLNADLGGGEVVEVGGQWIGPGQTRIAALADELGIGTFRTFDDGESILELGGETRRYSGTIPRLGPLVLADIALARLRLERMARRIPPEAPWEAPGAEALDARTFGDWLESGGMRTRAAREMLRVAARTVWGAEPDDMSLLHVLFYMRSAGGLDPLLDVEGGAQQERIVGGSQRIASALADGLGDRLRLGTPLASLSWSEDGVVATTAGGEEIRARRAVIALPPPLRAAIEISPAPQGDVAAGFPAGRLIKCAAVYPEPFWRADGLSGEALTDAGPVGLTFDNSPPGGSPGVLLGFVGGEAARRWGDAPAADRREAVLADFARIFGPRAAEPSDYLERDWGLEGWSGGGPTFAAPPGGWTSAGPAPPRAPGPHPLGRDRDRDPMGRVHGRGGQLRRARRRRRRRDPLALDSPPSEPSRSSPPSPSPSSSSSSASRQRCISTAPLMPLR